MITDEAVLDSRPTVNGADVCFQVGGNGKEWAGVTRDQELGQLDTEKFRYSHTILPRHQGFFLNGNLGIKRNLDAAYATGALAYDNYMLYVPRLVHGIESLDEPISVAAGRT